MDENNTTPTPEELQSEQEALAVVQDDKLRTDIVASLGLEDNEDNKAVIDKVFNLQKESRTKLSKAIGQKVDWRTKALDGKTPKPVSTVVAPVASQLTPEEIRKQTDASTRAALDEEFLDESDYSDELKQDIRDEAKRLNVSARKAVKSEFITFKIGKEKDAKRVNEAAKNGAGRGKTGTVIDPSKPLDPADYDLSTEEGRTEWDKAKKAKKAQREA